jgi:WD40 repeat protein
MSAAFSFSGSRILTASTDGMARIWDVATAKEILVLSGHENPVRSATFSPDESLVVTASGDKTARLWDVRFATMPTEDLLAEACKRRLGPLAELKRSASPVIPMTRPRSTFARALSEPLDLSVSFRA